MLCSMRSLGNEGDILGFTLSIRDIYLWVQDATPAVPFPSQVEEGRGSRVLRAFFSGNH